MPISKYLKSSDKLALVYRLSPKKKRKKEPYIQCKKTLNARVYR